MISNVVIHLNNEQPLLADLFSLPTSTDACLVCTNLRMMNGKRPVFAERSDSLFLFPLIHIRFVELLADAVAAATGGLPAVAGASQPVRPEPADAEPEPDLEIDEDFLRRVREI